MTTDHDTYTQTHDLGRLYWHTMRLPRDIPVLQLDGQSYEVDQPWRIGHCWILRVLSFALVIGWWGVPRTLSEVKSAEMGAETYLPNAHGEDADAEVERAAELGAEVIREQFREQPSTTTESPYDVRTWQ